MDNGDTLKPRPRRVKLNISDWTWQRVKMLAAWMELHIQDVAGHLVAREMERLWAGYLEDPDASHKLWEELMLEIRPDRKPIFEEGE